MFDLHVHAAPDIVDRRDDDIDTVRAYERAGFSGCVLKAHYESTVGRAWDASKGMRTRVYGGIALNRHVGGLNPAAVAATLQAGGRVVWFPTADSHTQHSAGLPRLCDGRSPPADGTYALPPIVEGNEAAISQICRLIADYDAVLATGHISAPEIAWLLPVARHCSVRRILLTHPSYTVPALSGEQARAFAAEGALVEITTFQLLYQPGCDAAYLAGFACDVGLENIVLSSDAGQPDSPPPPEALDMLIRALAREGLDESELRSCAGERPDALVTP